MSVGIVATIKIQAGKNAEFEAVAKEMMAAVRANEPGNLVYQFCKSKKDDTTYVVMELYADQAAMEAHGQSTHFKSIGPKMGPFMGGRPEIAYYDAV